MIQLDNRKKIIIISVSILVIIIAIIILLVIKNKSNSIIGNILNNNQVKTRQPRIMTKDEKINSAGIDPTQAAEVVNDQDSNYIYRLKK